MVTMIDIDDFLPLLLQYAPNTSDLVAYRHIVSTARDLCKRGRIWRESDTFEITAPEMQGLISIDNAEILTIEQAYLGDYRLEPRTVAWLDDNVYGWDISTDLGSARYVTQTNFNTITVVPRQTGTMKARFVLTPKIGADQLPEVLQREYSEEIGRGAAARVLTLPDGSIPQLGLDHRTWFQDRLDKLSVEAAKGQQNARLRTKGAYF